MKDISPHVIGVSLPFLIAHRTECLNIISYSWALKRVILNANAQMRKTKIREEGPKQAIHEDQLLDALLLILQIDNFSPQQLDVPRTIGILRDK